jgi:hypothetical protein
MHRWRLLSDIPNDQLEAYLKRREAEGKRLSRRGILVHFGKINVRAADIYEGTPFGDLAERLLKPIERTFAALDKSQRYALLHALRFRLRCIAGAADPEGDKRNCTGLLT